MSDLEKKIESVLLFKNEPVSFAELAKWLGVKSAEVKEAVAKLGDLYKDRGIVVVTDGERTAFGTHPDLSETITALQKEELSRELGRAGLETLAVILYKGPISRREIEYIRGVNSGYTLRNLLIRGLIERTEGEPGERSYTYKTTLELLRYLGVSRREDLPEFESASRELEIFSKTPEENNG